jgi:hypothetical protein
MRYTPLRDNRKTRDLDQPSQEKLQALAVQGKNWKEAGVHPSWAAKQMKTSEAKAAVVPFQGKKIVFAANED